jgi:pimeloyl-ACP methyl ester carboxylesterase
MVDVGGYRLHIHCLGSGSPTVVIDAGWGDWSASWSSWVQPDVAATTRVCTYDRAGMGYSDPGPLPRTADRFVYELHTALDAAGIPAPYVMVGHSLGGALVRVFAHEYATEVVGVVLIESMSPPASGSLPPQASPRSSADALITLPARIGLLRLLAGPLGLQDGLSPGVAGAYTAYSVTPRSWQTTMDEGRGMPVSLAQAGAVTTLAPTPLTVLSRGLDVKAEWQTEQTELLRLSSQSQQLIADRSGHSIQLDQPDAAVGAILTMIDQAARGVAE